MNNILLAFLLTLLAGLATGIGSCIAFFTKQTNTKFLSISLGFSAGVMIYVSMIELFHDAQTSLILEFGQRKGSYITVFSFFAGMLLIALIDKFIPEVENPHEIKCVESMEACEQPSSSKLLRTGVLTALAIGIHNFPEGLATFVAALENVHIAIPIVFAIALHNIPEGISVSVPIFYATGDKKKAFLYSFLSGMSEPIGALIGYLVLRPLFSDALSGIIFAGVAGIMVFISLDELLPTAREYGEHHLSIYGLIAGMLVMALSLIMFI